MINKTMTHDITYYVDDPRLAGPNDEKEYRMRDMITKCEELHRPLTDSEAKEFLIKE